MTHLETLESLSEEGSLPPSPEIAILAASLFRHLGGSFHIDPKGDRRILIPEPGAFIGERDKPPIPIPGAAPHDEFFNGDEFRGAMKLVSALIGKLDASDKQLIFEAYSYVATPIDLDLAKKCIGEGDDQ